MAPLTSPRDCASCLNKSQKIAELEQRISNLYWIRDEEARLDSVVSTGTHGSGNSTDLDSTVPVFDAGSPVANPASLAPAEWTSHGSSASH
ncbi:hypothetical protein ABVT39_019561 [Epinephelus coioides]